MSNKIDQTFNVMMGYYPDMTPEQAEALAVLLKEVYNEALTQAIRTIAELGASTDLTAAQNKINQLRIPFIKV